uniref:Uncharacterized protein n=1 Tax=Amphimedon queenslandica TaxID=400682 RepID=A0A1X7UBB7_AMPQE
MDDAMIKYCVSWFSIRVEHKSGKLNGMMAHANMAAIIDSSILPEATDAVHEIESLASHLTYFSGFEIDLLQGCAHIVERNNCLR